jgi:hypothetical protein
MNNKQFGFSGVWQLNRFKELVGSVNQNFNVEKVKQADYL